MTFVLFVIRFGMEESLQNTVPMAAELPTISVLVLNYNGLEHLEPCFRSLQELEYPADKLEFVLIDNASRDGSVEFMQAHFPAVKIVRHPENYGFSKGNNLGAREASGQLVAFLNNDMRVDRRWLIELVQPLLRDPGVVCAASKILSWDGRQIDYAGSGMNILGYGYQEGWGEPPTAHSEEKFILAPCGGAMLVDRRVFLQSGGFDEEFFAFYEDLDLGWRLWVLGYQVVYAPRAITYHVHHGWWGKAPGEKMAVLYQRNAFSSLVKNYDDQNLGQVLPVALLLFLRRAFLATGVDPSPFRPEPQAVAPHLHAEIPHPDTEAASSLPAPALSTAPQIYGSVYYFRETWRTLRQEGLVRLWRKAIAEVRRRWPRCVRLRKQRQARPGHVFVASRAISHLIAADDLVQGLDLLMQKRRTIQSRRGRPDREIIPIFRWPLASDNPNPHYMQTMDDLITASGLRDSLECEGERDEAGADHQR